MELTDVSQILKEKSKGKTFEEMKIELDGLIEKNEIALARMTTTTTQQRLKKGNLTPLEKLESSPEKPLLRVTTWAIILSSTALGLVAGYLIWGLP